jgi:hypothetical protein
MEIFCWVDGMFSLVAYHTIVPVRRAGGGSGWPVGGQRGARCVLPPFRFGEPIGDMSTFRIQLAGLVKCGDRFVKLPLCQV